MLKKEEPKEQEESPSLQPRHGESSTAPVEGEGAETAEESAGALKEKVKDYWEQLVRLQADFANYRKRTEKEKGEAIRFGREVMLERLISLNDVMDEALKHSNNASDIGSLKKGFEMVVGEFSRFLKSEGAEPLKTVGEVFDPHLHEALEQVPTDNESENDKILEEIQKGYMLNGRLLRPAKVKVAKYVQDAGKKEETE